MQCKLCSFEAKNIKQLSIHISKTHKINPKEYYDEFLKQPEEGFCKKCGRGTVYESLKKGYREFCSIQCMTSSKEVKKRKENTSLERFGVKSSNQAESVKQRKKETYLKNFGVETPFENEGIKQKFRQNYLEKHGVDHPWKDKKIKEKIKQTCFEKYGVENAFQNKEIQQKQLETMVERYGVEKPLQNESIRQKTKQTCIEKYGFETPLQNEQIKEKVRKSLFLKRKPEVSIFLKKLNIQPLEAYTHTQKLIKVKCLKCDTIFESCYFYMQQGYGFCPNCYPKYKSIAETAILDFVKSLNFNTIENSRKIISPLELDIFIPEKNIALEYNGSYWHSELKNNDKNYHLNKLNMCRQKNINLIQIFEDEWVLHQDIVKARLKQILNMNDSQRIHARCCIIKSIPSNIKNEFLIKYHLQGTDNSPVSLGAFFENKLIAVMTFNHGSLAKGIKNKNPLKWELNRYCCDYHFHIPGVASKLLSYFKKNYEWESIYSFADRRWSNGNMYYKLGFSLDSITKPNYWYIKKGGIFRIHRFSLRKKQDEPKDIPEWLLRVEEGYTRIWDCGNLKFNIIKI